MVTFNTKYKSELVSEKKESLICDPDPRLHFCLHNMCKSGPGLRFVDLWTITNDRVYTVDGLNKELNDSMIQYLENHLDLQIDSRKKVS